ncbi:VOC family protein [Desulfopila sp. IMCC35008]|uniref:VOC family protein n=1 Tax=Desulfopila sp. IMCC35008 TaxID=2653858 RepID=UPI0013D2BD52|nr:VOC family protein [Desulfopila sp. IMCC35008]
MKIKRIGHYNLVGSASLIARVITFYKDVLGFTEGFRPDFGVAGAWLYIGDSPLLHLTIMESMEDSAVSTGNLDHIALDCEGLNAFMARLNEKGVEYLVGKVPELNMTQLFIHDPAGTRIELNFTETESQC